LYALADFGYMINLFNLLPIGMMGKFVLNRSRTIGDGKANSFVFQMAGGLPVHYHLTLVSPVWVLAE